MTPPTLILCEYHNTIGVCIDLHGDPHYLPTSWCQKRLLSPFDVFITASGIRLSTAKLYRVDSTNGPFINATHLADGIQITLWHRYLRPEDLFLYLDHPLWIVPFRKPSITQIEIEI